MARSQPVYTANLQTVTTTFFLYEHPRHILNGIPYSQFVRVKCSCSKQKCFLSNCYMLSAHFIRCGYPKDLVISALNRANKLFREDLKQQGVQATTEGILYTEKTKSTDKGGTFYCITTHNPQKNFSQRGDAKKTGNFLAKLKQHPSFLKQT